MEKKINELEVNMVVNALSKESIMWRLYCLGILAGGFRLLELNEVEWSHINFDENTITSRRNSSSITIDMPKWYMDELKLYHDNCLNRRNEGKEILSPFQNSDPH
ncbi:MAG: hypothetical protein WDZ91_01345 [Paenibacillaceae bacterium]